MSEENVELVRSLWAQFDGVNLAAVDWNVEGVREALGQSYSPEIELTTLQSGFGLGVDEFYRGVDGLVRYLNEWLEPFSEYFIENHEFIDAGDCVVVPGRQTGVGEGSGVEVALEITTLLEVRDGLIVRWHQYETTEEALADARQSSG